MTPHEFIAKWKRANLSERSAAQEHFLDLCALLGQPTPASEDPDGAWYTFERGVRKTDGGSGWADVWMRGKFAWEYKRKKKDLKEAYKQLNLYREALENPPLLVVCDLDRFEIHTNFTGTATHVFAFNLDGLANPENLDTLRKVFTDPEALRPDTTTARITEEAAAQFTLLADGLRARGVPAEQAAHFLMKLIFCLFAEDIGLLRSGLFTGLLEGARNDPERLARRMQALFEAMAHGGDFGAEEIAFFNGGLFADSECIELTRDEIERLVHVSGYGWENVEPSIFGTLFERLLDPSKRSQIGAHYTSREDILTLVEPVLMAPLRREWEEVQAKCARLAGEARKARTARTKRNKFRQRDRALRDFIEHLAHVTVLDPACGSGNFLYVAINLLLDLEKEVIAYAQSHEMTLLPHVRPTQLHGIEINPYAQQLAQVVIWIGYLQWMHHNGYRPPSDPVLEPIETIERRDAILDLRDPAHPAEPQWPKADVIVGNPPFLGGKLLRTHLGDEYVDALFHLWDGRVPREADICCYWFEKGRGMIERDRAGRVGLLATQGIRGGANRKVLQRIKQTGDIFFAESDRDWILDGAAVHVSMVGFDDATEAERVLDSTPATSINSNLTSQTDVTGALRLKQNGEIAFMGTSKGGAFDINDRLARGFLELPNPHGRPNSDVIVPWINGSDLTGRRRSIWIIDFGVDMPLEEAARYEAPFDHVVKHIRPTRERNRRKTYRERWWIHVEPRPAMRTALAPLSRFLVTARVSKHRLFAWFERPTLPDSATFAFALADDCFFGLMHSRVHEVWARAQGTQVRERESGFRYTPTTCFETFPFPEATAEQKGAIGEAARELDRLRNHWLNPPEWMREEVLEFPGSVDGPWGRYVHEPDGRGIGTVRYARLVPKDVECAEELKKRTLTNLYNARPTWLELAHCELDRAVFAAYGWDAGMGDEEVLERVLGLNLERGGEG